MRAFARAAVVSALAVSVVVVIVSGLPGPADAQASAATAFPTATVHLERNATDNDFEVVFEVKGADDGLAELTVVSPDRRTVVAFKAPDASTLGKPGQATATVSVKGLKLAWKPVEGVAFYSVGIKHEESNVNLMALLPA